MHHPPLKPDQPSANERSGYFGLGLLSFLDTVLGPQVDSIVDQASDVLESSSILLASTNNPSASSSSSPSKAAASRAWLNQVIERNAFLETELEKIHGSSADGVEQVRLAAEQWTTEAQSLAAALEDTSDRNDLLG